MIKHLSLIFVLLAVLQAQYILNENGVLLLDDSNIDIAIHQNNYLLIEFYAKWCEPCMSFAPEYTSLVQKFRDANMTVAVAKIDGDISKFSTSRYNIKNYPTFKLMINTHALSFEGARNKAVIFDWVKASTGESLDELPSIGDIEDFLLESDVSLVYFMDSHFHKNLNVFNIVSRMYPEIAFGYTDSVAAQKKYKVRKNSIVLFKNFDEERIDFGGRITDKAVIDFVDQNAYPILSEFDERTEERIFKKGQSALFLLVDDGTLSQQYKSIILKIAPHIKKRIQVVLVDQMDGFVSAVTEKLGVENAKFPELYFYHQIDGKSEAFSFTKEFTIENIFRFIDQANKGKLQKIYRSQQPPLYQNSALRVVVGSTFSEVVELSGKDVLVMFCTAWSKDWQQQQQQQQQYQSYYSKLIQTLVEELAESLQSNPNLLVVSIDPDQNEIPNINTQITKFPTFRFYRALLPSVPVEYKEEKFFDVIDTIEFIRQNTGYPWVTPVKANTIVSDL